jgi:hypothetical protein
MGVETLPSQRKMPAWQVRLWHHTAYNNFDVPRLAQEEIKHRLKQPMEYEKPQPKRKLNRRLSNYERLIRKRLGRQWQK